MSLFESFREFNILLVTSSSTNQIATFPIRTQAIFYYPTMVCCLLCSSSTQVLPMVLLGLVVSFLSLLPLWQAWDVVRFFRSNLMTHQNRWVSYCRRIEGFTCLSLFNEMFCITLYVKKLTVLLPVCVFVVSEMSLPVLSCISPVDSSDLLFSAI